MITHPIMEEITHANQKFPLSEFVDHFDTFPDGSFPSHWHNEMELQIILRGRAEYKVNGVSYILEEGCGIYLAPGVIHMAKALTDNTIGYDIVLSPQLLVNLMHYANCERYAAPLSNRRPDALLITPERKEGYHILESLKRMYYAESAHTTYELFFLEHLIGIWRNLLALFPKDTANEDDNSKLLREERMKLMMEFIHQNYAQNITVQDIANAAHISKSECFRCFSELSETSPVDYINTFRLMQAAMLLRSTDKSMSDICFMTGFNNTSYFSKKFKEQYDMTPKTYRAKKHE